MKKPLSTLFTAVFLALLLISIAQCQNEKSGKPEVAESAPAKSNSNTPTSPDSNAVSADSLESKIITRPDGTFGYDIYRNGKLFVHQMHIPAVPSNKGFTTKEDAEKVAQKAIEKIRNGKIPPSISQEELRELGVIE